MRLHENTLRRLEVLKEWFASGRRDPNARYCFCTSKTPNEQFGGTLLHCVLACSSFSSRSNAPHRSDRSDLIRFLVSRGADVNLFFDCRPTTSYTLPPALHLCQFPGEVEALLDAGADIDMRAMDECYYGSTALHCHAYFGRSALVNVLVRRGANVLSTDEYGDNALVLARWRERRYNEGETAAFLEKVMAAGGWKPYSNAPRVELVQLRELCERDRATPPPESILERLFDVAALPKEVFWHVISFWRSSRDDQEDVEPDETDDDESDRGLTTQQARVRSRPRHASPARSPSRRTTRRAPPA